MSSLFLSLILSFAFASDIELRSLVDVSSMRVKPSQAQVFVLFQKDCHACHKQVKDLQCLGQQQKVSLVGLFSTEKDLRDEYKSFKTQIQGFYGDKEFMKKFGINRKLTPQILIIGPSKRFLILGLTECQKIKDWLEKV